MAFFFFFKGSENRTVIFLERWQVGPVVWYLFNMATSRKEDGSGSGLSGVAVQPAPAAHLVSAVHFSLS